MLKIIFSKYSQLEAMTMEMIYSYGMWKFYWPACTHSWGLNLGVTS